MNSRTVIIVIITVLVVAAVIYAVYALMQEEPAENVFDRDTEEIQQELTNEEQEEEESVEVTGNAVRNNPGLLPDTWYVVYEEQGAPALTLELEFNDDSICITGDPGVACDEALEQGERITVRGQRTNDTIIVEELSAINGTFSP